jgi:hypothetical protein
MAKTIFGLLSFWSGVALMAMLVAQALPMTGPAMEAVGSAFVAGWLIHLCLLFLLVDSLTGRLPLFFALVPAIAYCGYYAAYWDQGRYIEKRATHLKSANPGKILTFDDKIYSLVMDKADVFAASHDVRVVYDLDKSYHPDGYASYRLFTLTQAEQIIRNATDRIQTLSVYWNGVNQPNVRELRIPSRPTGRTVSVTVNDSPGSGWSDRNIGEITTSIELDRKQIGVFRSAYVERLPKFPFLAVGCRYSPAGLGRKCYADFIEEKLQIDSTPAGVNREEYDDPISIMLGIRVLSEKAIKRLSDNPAYEVVASKPAPRQTPDADDAFAALGSILDGQTPVLPRDAIETIVRDPSRLTPLAARLAKRFVELNRPDATEIPGRREQAALLAAALASLNSADFAAIADQLDETLRPDAGLDYPALYLRAADRGASAFPHYRDRFLSPDSSRLERLLAALAICRIGLADGELISTLESRWSEADPPGKRDNNYKAALFVALLKLGQGDYARKAPRSDSSLLNGWYAAVLAGHGKTETGPNNCMPLEWPVDEIAPPNLMPSLRWSQKDWIVVGPK